MAKTTITVWGPSVSVSGLCFARVEITQEVSGWQVTKINRMGDHFSEEVKNDRHEAILDAVPEEGFLCTIAISKWLLIE